jgi:type IV secretory pathway TraG/TraD family ATPase VirD4
MYEVVLIAVLVGGAMLGWRARPRRLGLVFGAGGLAVLLVVRAIQQGLAWLSLSGWLPVVGVLVVLAPLVAVVGWYLRTHSRAVVTRWGRSLRRKSGVASTSDIARIGSWMAMRRQAATVRPSLGQLTRRERVRVATTEVGIPLCRVGLMRVWASVEDVIVMFGGPRTGKSGSLACRIIDAPGAVLVTSTRTDLYERTSALRRAHRGPVHVFNPVGLAGMASSITFNPVSGCGDPVTAAERAEDMLPGGAGDSDHDHWVSQARQALAALLHAAALGERPMRSIAEWIADPDKAKAEVAGLLRRSPDETGAYATSAEQFLGTNDRTRSSITSSMRPALAWLTNSHARAAAAGGVEFDVAQLLRDRATVYLLGAKAAHTAPLVAALTGHIAREARRIAAAQPSGRLDPPLTLALDEAALICPIPLQDWTADMGGRGVHIVACFQSRAQLISRWGEPDAAEIINNAGGIVLFGGTRDQSDLQYWSTLFGSRDEEVLTTDQQGRVTGRSVRSVPVFSPAQLANLPKKRVVVSRRHMPPVVGRAAMVWERRDVRAQTRATRAADRAVIAAAERATRMPWLAEVRRRRTERLVDTAQRRGQGRL